VKQEPKTTIASRTHLLRKTLKLTQSEFADKLKLKFGIISAMEVSRTPLTEQNLKMICYEFNVSEQAKATCSLTTAHNMKANCLTYSGNSPKPPKN
jgi:transcriptional regulator with XRE-family HTH domain